MRVSRASADEAAGHHVERAVVKLAQQRRLPAVPHLRPDRADIGGGQHQQQLQPLGRLHALDESLDRLRVADVALEGGVAHQEVPAHQPRDGLGLLGASGPSRGPSFSAIFSPIIGMVAAAALGDVVQQGRDIKRAARGDGSA